MLHKQLTSFNDTFVNWIFLCPLFLMLYLRSIRIRYHLYARHSYMCICMFRFTQHLKPSPHERKKSDLIFDSTFLFEQKHRAYTRRCTHTDYWLIPEMRECIRISDMQLNSNKLKTNRTIFCFVYLQLSYVERCETCFQYHKNFSNYNGVQCYTHARKFAHSIRLKLMFLLFFFLLLFCIPTSQ